MRILVISQFYSPDITAAAFRIQESVDLLRSSGHDVRVITSHPHKGLVDGNEGQENEHGIHRVKVLPIKGGGMRRYLQHYFSFVFGSLSKGISIRFGKWRPDAIWATSPPLFVGISGTFLARIWGCPLVFDVRDIWPESAVAAGQLSASGRGFRIGKMLERRLYNAADHITCVSRPMAGYIGEQTDTPVTVIYNGVLRSAVPGTDRGTPQKRILYAGNLGRVQGLDTIATAFAQATSQGMLNGWTLEFMGSGVLEQELREHVAKLGISDRVVFHAPVRKETALQELTQSAVLFLNLMDDGVFSLTIPSKVFDYMIANRPILFGIVGEGRDIMERTGGNISFTPSDTATLLHGLREIDAHYAQFAKQAKQNREIALELYSREQGVETLMSVFEQVRR